MIEVIDLRKSFGSQKVLDGISFKIEAGDSVVIIGRSGCGKSVLLKHIIGLIRADSGEVIVRYRRHGQAERIEVAGAALRTADRLVQSLRRGLLALTDRTQLRAAGLVTTRLLSRSELSGFGREQIYELLSDADQRRS